MENLRNIESKIEGLLSENKIEKFTSTVVEEETREFNAEHGCFTLFRTLFDKTLVLKVFKGSKCGLVAGNDLSDEGLKSSVESAISTCDASQEDPANDIAPNQGKDVFRQGSFEPDLDLFFRRTKELLDTITKEYPKIKVMLYMARHLKKHSLLKTSNGTEFERFAGSYSVSLEFSANDGTKTTGIDGFGFETLDLDTPFIEQGNTRSRLTACVNQLTTTQIKEKFEGTVIFTPDCFGQFLSMTVGNYASDKCIIDGTSLWIDKIGKQVADKRLTVTISPDDKRLVCPACTTGDGIRCESTKVIEKGILKTFVLALYGANKTGNPVTKANMGYCVVDNSTEKLDKMISNVKNGLLVGGFSGGHPQTNGEFSGVAKNSFYIEDGKIKGAVSETMISGNLGKMLMNIESISEETACDGNTVFPYVAVNGIVISGK